jgi:hypothetical protein
MIQAIYMYEYPESFGFRFTTDWPVHAPFRQPWRYHAFEDHPWFDHDHNPVWGRSVLLGAYLASGGDW